MTKSHTIPEDKLKSDLDAELAKLLDLATVLFARTRGKMPEKGLSQIKQADHISVARALHPKLEEFRVNISKAYENYTSGEISTALYNSLICQELLAVNTFLADIKLSKVDEEKDTKEEKMYSFGHTIKEARRVIGDLMGKYITQMTQAARAGEAAKKENDALFSDILALKTGVDRYNKRDSDSVSEQYAGVKLQTPIMQELRTSVQKTIDSKSTNENTGFARMQRMDVSAKQRAEQDQERIRHER